MHFVFYKKLGLNHLESWGEDVINTLSEVL